MEPLRRSYHQAASPAENTRVSPPDVAISVTSCVWRSPPPFLALVESTQFFKFDVRTSKVHSHACICCCFLLTWFAWHAASDEGSKERNTRMHECVF